jgi:hypothetical protein
LKSLRQQLDKMKQAKDEIVALRLKTIPEGSLACPSMIAPRNLLAEFKARLGIWYGMKR